MINFITHDSNQLDYRNTNLKNLNQLKLERKVKKKYMKQFFLCVIELQMWKTYYKLSN